MEKSVIYHLPLFESSQILSHVHLNDLRNYLDMENRDTRTQLIGAGIVCGLHLNIETGKDSIAVQISPGHGITTDGYILGLKRRYSFTRYKDYTDPINDGDVTDTKYLFGKDSASAPPPLFELFEEDENVENFPLADFDERQKVKFDNMAVVLYLEETKTDLRSCTGTNCDNKGKRDDRLIRVLLIRKSDLEKYNNELLSRRPNTFTRIPVPRPLLHTAAPIDSDMKLRNEYGAVITAIRSNIDNVINDALKTLSIPLALNKNAWDVTRPKLNTFGNGHKYYQYSYDALCDIIHTYNEFLDAAELFARGCKKLEVPNLFPLHLVIGEITYGKATFHDEYRTTFFNIMPVDAQDEKLVTAQLRYEKLLLLIHRYLPTAGKPVSITPSRYHYAPYESWAIPAYYGLSTTQNRLAEIWSPQQYLEGREPGHFHYDVNLFMDDAPLHLREPFRFDKKPFPYYRVENLGGKKIEDAVKAVKELRELYGLNFDIKVATLENVKLHEMPCGVEDLQEEYLFARHKLLNVFDTIRSYIETFLLYPEVKEMLGKEISKEMIGEDLLNAWKRLYSDVSATLPLCLVDFDYTRFRDTYKKYANIIIEAVMKIAFTGKDKGLLDGGILDGGSNKESIDPPKEPVAHFESTAASLVISLGSRIIFGLLRSFYYRQVYNVYYAYEMRRKKSEKKPHTLRDYLRQFPGMEHIAGTLENGTLLLVCSSNPAPAIGTSIVEESTEIFTDKKPGIFSEITKNEFTDLLIKDINYDIALLPDSENVYVIRPNLTKEQIEDLKTESPESPIVKKIIAIEEEIAVSDKSYDINLYIKGDSISTSNPINVDKNTIDKIIESSLTTEQPELLRTENPLLDIEDGNVTISKTRPGINSNDKPLFLSPITSPRPSGSPTMNQDEFRMLLLGKLDGSNDIELGAKATVSIIFERGIITKEEQGELHENLLNYLSTFEKTLTSDELADSITTHLVSLNLLTETIVDPPKEEPSKSNDWLQLLGDVLQEVIKAINSLPPPVEIIKEDPVPPANRFVVADFFIGADTCPCDCDNECPDEKDLASLPIPPLAHNDFVLVARNKAVEIYPELNDIGITGDTLEVVELADDIKVVSEKGVVLASAKHEKQLAFLYEAPKDYVGADRFTYTVRNRKNGLTDTANVWIIVNDSRKKPSISMGDYDLCYQDPAQPITLSADGWNPGELDIIGTGVINPSEGNWLFDPKNPGVTSGSYNIELVEVATKEVLQTITVNVVRLQPSFDLVSATWSDIIGPDNKPQKRLTAKFSSSAPGADNWLWSITYLKTTRTFTTSDVTIELDVATSVTHVDLAVELYVSNGISGCGSNASGMVFGFDNERENPSMSIDNPPKVFCKNDGTVYPITITYNGWKPEEVAVNGSGIVTGVNPTTQEVQYGFRPSQATVINGLTQVQLINVSNGNTFQTINVAVEATNPAFALSAYTWNTFGNSERISFFIVNNTPLNEADTFEWYINNKPYPGTPRDLSQMIDPSELDREFRLRVKLVAYLTDSPCRFEYEELVPMPPQPKEPVRDPFPLDPQPTIPIVTELLNPVLTTPVNPIVTEPLIPLVTTPVNPIVTEPLIPLVTTPVNPILTTPVNPIVTEPLTPLVTTPVNPILTTPVNPILTTPLIPAQPNQTIINALFVNYANEFNELVSSTAITEGFAGNTLLLSRLSTIKTTLAKFAALTEPLSAVTETSVGNMGVMIKTLITPVSGLTEKDKAAGYTLTHHSMMLFWMLVGHRKTDITTQSTFVGYANFIEGTTMPFLQSVAFGVKAADRAVFIEMSKMADKPALTERYTTYSKLR